MMFLLCDITLYTFHNYFILRGTDFENKCCYGSRIFTVGHFWLFLEKKYDGIGSLVNA